MKNLEKVYLDSNLQIVFGITLMSALGIFSISPALPKIAQGLHVSPQDVGLLITVFSLPGIFLMPLMGIAADLFGKKLVLVPSLLLFGVAGGACIFVRDFNIILICRFFQGIGAASLSSLTIAVISDLYTGRTRTAAMGYNQSVFSVGAIVFAIAGGALTLAGWYYAFLLPFLAIPVGFLVMFFLKPYNKKAEGLKNLKYFIRNIGVTLRQRQIIILYIVTIVTFVVWSSSYAIYFPVLIGIEFNKSPFFIGLIMSSMSLSQALTSFQIVRIINKASKSFMLGACFILYALGMIIIPYITNTIFFFVPAIILGMAQGINLPIIQVFLSQYSTDENRSTIMSLYGVALRIGQTTGPLLMGLMFALGGIGSVFYLSCCIVLMTGGLVFATIKES